MLKQDFFAVADGRGLFFELLPLRAGGLPVCATAARIGTHAHAMPPATQPAVTQASPILFGCRVHAGQVLSAEDPHDGGLLAGRVAVERSESLSLAVTSLFESEEPARTVRYLRTSILCSFAWDGTHECSGLRLACVSRASRLCLACVSVLLCSPAVVAALVIPNPGHVRCPPVFIIQAPRAFHPGPGASSDARLRASCRASCLLRALCPALAVQIRNRGNSGGPAIQGRDSPAIPCAPLAIPAAIRPATRNRGDRYSRFVPN
mgnify:CR=1 FL=1